MLGALISAGSSLLGGFLNRKSTEENNNRLIQQAELNRQMQYEFAQNGIRWKVDDAKAAGIHPLYALGASTQSYSPVSVGTAADSSFGSGLASAGQDISRAINATRTSSERSEAVTKTVQDLELTNMGLKNELLATQIAKLKAAPNPPMPDGKSESGDRDLQLWEGEPKVSTPKVEAKQEKIEDEYGDDGLPAIPGQLRFVRDWLKSQGYEWGPRGIANAVRDGVLWMDRNLKVFAPPKGSWK